MINRRTLLIYNFGIALGGAMSILVTKANQPS